MAMRKGKEKKATTAPAADVGKAVKAARPRSGAGFGDGFWVMGTFLMAGLAVTAMVLFSIESGRNEELSQFATQTAAQSKRQLATLTQRLQAFEALGQLDAAIEAKTQEVSDLERELGGMKAKVAAGMEQAKRARGKKRDQLLAKLKEDFEGQVGQLEAKRVAAATELAKLRSQSQGLRAVASRGVDRKGPPPPEANAATDNSGAGQDTEPQGEE